MAACRVLAVAGNPGISLCIDVSAPDKFLLRTKDYADGLLRLNSMQGLMILMLGLLTVLGCSSQGGSATDTFGPGTTGIDSDAAVVSIGEATYAVDLAILPEERQQGLSGRESMPQDSGMLFVFEEERVLHFWMKEMHFPLDIIWIDARCSLLEVAANVPPPYAGNDDIPRVHSPSPARFVLEVNAGEAARNGLQAGDQIEFLGAIAGKHGC